jgi:hypothetical protein
MDLVDLLNSYYGSLQLRKRIYQLNPSIETQEDALGSFDSVLSKKMDFSHDDLIKGSIYEYVIQEFSPHLKKAD